MNKKTILIAALTVSQFAQADIIKCVFTEPFYGLTYSTTQSTLTKDEFADDGNPVLTKTKNVSFQIKDAGRFDLMDSKGKVLVELHLNKNGSDGMSDRVYPYEAIVMGEDGKPTLSVGGCTSNFLHAKEDSAQ